MKAPLSRFAYVIALLAVMSYAVMTLSGPRGISAWLEKERQIQSLKKHNGDLNRENERARDRIDRLTNNPDEQGRAARERLNYVEKRDKVYVTGDPAPAGRSYPDRVEPCDCGAAFKLRAGVASRYIRSTAAPCMASFLSALRAWLASSRANSRTSV